MLAFTTVSKYSLTEQLARLYTLLLLSSHQFAFDICCCELWVHLVPLRSCFLLRVSFSSCELTLKEQRSRLCRPWWQGKRWNLTPSPCTESCNVSVFLSIFLTPFLCFTLFTVCLRFVVFVERPTELFYSNWNVKCRDWKQTQELQTEVLL